MARSWIFSREKILHSLKSYLLHLARSPMGLWLIGWGFANMSFALPIHRLRETATFIAFYHPAPTYPVHILLVPKKKLASLDNIGLGDAEFLTDLFRTVQELVRELNLEQVGYRLIANGGKYQDVPQLHFHLISGAHF